jgi:hypothetical protein
MRRHPAYLVTIAVGLIFVAVGAYTYVYMGRFLDHAREVRAVVIEVRHESATPNGRRHPVVKFRTPAGVEVVAHSDEHRNVRPADTVQVVYDERHPQDIELTTLEQAHRRRLVITGISVAIGLLVCGMGVRQGLEKSEVKPGPDPDKAEV